MPLSLILFPEYPGSPHQLLIFSLNLAAYPLVESIITYRALHSSRPILTFPVILSFSVLVTLDPYVLKFHQGKSSVPN